MDLRLPNGAYPETIRDTDGHEYDIVYNPEGMKVWERSEEVTLTGDTIVMPNVARERIEAFTIYGRSEQNQYKGYNLLQAGWSGTRTVNGLTLTFNTDGGIKINGTASATVSIPFLPYTANAGDVFYLRVDSALNKRYTDTYLQVYNGLGVDNRIAKPCEGTVTATVTQSATGVVRIRIAAGQVFGNDTLYPMLTLTPETVYEPYVGGKPSPSPEYPQEIVSVTEPSIFRAGANLFSVDFSKGGNSNVNVSYIGSNLHLTSNKSGAFVQTGVVTDISLNQLPRNTQLVFSFLIKAATGANIKPFLVLMGFDSAGNRILYQDLFAKTFFSIPDSVETLNISAVMNQFNPIDVGDSVTFSEISIFQNASPDQTFEPHKPTATIKLPYTLRGIDNVRDSLTVYADGSGKVAQMFFAFDITENSKIQALNRYSSLYKDLFTHLRMRDNSIKKRGLMRCDNFVYDFSWNANHECIYPVENSVDVRIANSRLGVNSDDGDDVRTVKAKEWLKTNHMHVVAELNTPITIALTPSEVQSILATLKPYKPTTTIWNDQDADMSVTYRKGIAAQSST